MIFSSLNFNINNSRGCCEVSALFLDIAPQMPYNMEDSEICVEKTSRKLYAPTERGLPR